MKTKRPRNWRCSRSWPRISRPGNWWRTGRRTTTIPFAPFFRKVVDKAHEVGFFSLTLPEELGGGGQGVEALALVLDAVCQADASLGGIIFANALAQEICLQAGEREALAVPDGGQEVREALLAFPAYDDPRHTRATLEAGKKGKGYSLSGSIDYVALASLGSRALLPAGSGEGGWRLPLPRRAGRCRHVRVRPGVQPGAARLPGLRPGPAGRRGEAGGGGREGRRIFLGRLRAHDGRRRRPGHRGAEGLGAGGPGLRQAASARAGGRSSNWSEVRMILANMAIAAQSADLLVEGACRAVDGAGARLGALRRRQPPSRPWTWPATPPPTASSCWAATATWSSTTRRNAFATPSRSRRCWGWRP